MSFEESLAMNKAIVDNINAHCELSGITRSEFEEKVGVSRGYFARIASTGNAIALVTAKRVADELHTTLDEIIGTSLLRRLEIAIKEMELKACQEETERRVLELERLKAETAS